MIKDIEDWIDRANQSLDEKGDNPFIAVAHGEISTQFSSLEKLFAASDLDTKKSEYIKNEIERLRESLKDHYAKYKK